MKCRDFIEGTGDPILDLFPHKVYIPNTSSIFSDEGEILEDSIDPDLDYNQLIRPIKSRLAIFYLNNISFKLDMMIIFLTFISLIKRDRALKKIHKILYKLNADSKLIQISLRKEKLQPMAPPGLISVVSSREK